VVNPFRLKLSESLASPCLFTLSLNIVQRELGNIAGLQKRESQNWHVTHAATCAEVFGFVKRNLSGAQRRKGCGERGGSPSPRLNAEAAGARSALNRTRQKRIGGACPDAG